VDAGRIRTYLFWAFWAGVAFFSVYPAMNWITAQRESVLHLYVGPELRIPFVPQFIWAYLSMYVLFVLPMFFIPAANMPPLGKQLIASVLISGVMFLILPAELGFARTVPQEPPYASIYKTLFGIDRPHNLVPSLHVIWSTAIVLACADFAKPAARVVLWIWLAIITASTLFVHQHHLIDLIAAWAIVFALRRVYEVRHA